MKLVIAALLAAVSLPLIAARGSEPSKETQAAIAEMESDGDIVIGCDGCGCEFCCVHSCSSRCGAPKECETIGCSFCQCAVAQCIDLIMEQPRRNVCLPSAYSTTVTVLNSSQPTGDVPAYIVRRSGSMEREDVFDQGWGTGDRRAVTIIRDLDAGKEHLITYDGHDKATSCIQRPITASLVPKCLATQADVEGSSLVGGSLKVETLRQLVAPYERSEVQLAADTGAPLQWSRISKQGFTIMDFTNFKAEGELTASSFTLPKVCAA